MPYDDAYPAAAVLSVRVSPNERALPEAAAAHSRTNLSDFIRRKAIEAAEMDVLEHRVIAIPAKDWMKFEGPDLPFDPQRSMAVRIKDLRQNGFGPA